MRWKKFVLTLILLLLFAPLPSSYAQEYYFSLDQETVDVWINQDGSVRLEYWFTFTCGPSAHPIDVVDLGLPTNDYNLDDIYGYGGKYPATIKTDYQGSGYGVAVWLGEGTIRPGETGQVHVIVERIEGMLYTDSQGDDYASIKFSPTWFGSRYVHGTTNLTVRFHMPPGVQPTEPRWHSSPSGWPTDRPEADIDETGRIVYIWNNPEASPSRQYIFGASFPRQYVAPDAVQEPPSFLIATLTSIFTAVTSTICNPGCWVTLGVTGLIVFSIYSQQRRKMRYLPPRIKVEGVGIKRGLTAIEAAILMETPLDKVMTMILFGLLKKGVVTVEDDNPLRVKINEPLPEKLHAYEQDFLEAVKKDGTLSEKRLRSAMVRLIKAVNNKMKGFSRRETIAYYRDIIRRAWQQVERAGTPEVISQRYSDALEWMMLDKDFDDRTERLFRSQPVYVPTWWWYYRPWTRTLPAGTTPASIPSKPVRLPQLPGSAFAANLVRGISSTSSNIIHGLSKFTSGVTAVTNPLPKTSSSGRSYGGGGSSCACACACAGCACACAGGGR